MSKNAKNLLFCLLLTILPLFSNGCFTVASQQSKNAATKRAKFSSNYAAPQIVGKIDNPEIIESSGIAASPCQPNVFWTHNDSGDKAEIFALDSTGKTLATFIVKEAKNDDWEDIAAFKDRSGECFLFIGDIGNNALTRGEFAIYRVREPNVAGQAADEKENKPAAPLAVLEESKKLKRGGEPLTAPERKIAETETAETIKFEYSDARHDAETLMVNPQTGDIYVVTKSLVGAAAVYKLAANQINPKINRLEKIGDIAVPAVPNGFITGGDIAPDGKRAVLCDYFGGYEYVLPENSKNFDDIWKAAPVKIELGDRTQGEAVGYSADGKAIFATSEKSGSPIIEVKRK